jgi:hypothetical protein
MIQPTYLSFTGHGNSCGEPPGVFTGAVMHLFGIEVDRNAVQRRLVDTLLNAVPNSPVRYSCFLDMALVSFMHIDKCTTPTEVIGWVPGNESAIWIPLLEKVHPDLLPTRIVLWAPYIFIDYAIGMVTGREVWGWSKAAATIDMPATASTSPSFNLCTMVFDHFGIDTQGHERLLLSVEGTAPLGTHSTWSDARTAVREVVARLSGVQAPKGPDPLGADLIIQTVALKQLRDSLTPKLACFQAIVNSPVEMTRFNGGGFHHGNFSLRVTTCDSHQIVADLTGVAPSRVTTTLPVRFAGWLAFDFRALPGAVVAQSI